MKIGDDEVKPAPKVWIHDGSIWKYRYICSFCGFKIFEKPTKFCPNCGSKMNGKQK